MVPASVPWFSKTSRNEEQKKNFTTPTLPRIGIAFHGHPIADNTRLIFLTKQAHNLEQGKLADRHIIWAVPLADDDCIDDVNALRIGRAGRPLGYMGGKIKI